MGEEKKNKLLLEFDILLGKICLKCLSLVTFIFLVYFSYYAYIGIKFLGYVFGVCLVISLIYLYISYKINYQSFKVLIPLYFVIITLAISLNALFFWKFGQVAFFMWYMVIPVAMMIFFNKNVVIFSGIFILILFCSVFIITYFLPISYLYINEITEKQLNIVNISTILISLGLILFFIYYLNKVNLIKELIRVDEYENEITSLKEKETEDNLNKFNAIYAEILKYFDEKKSFYNPDFTISELAKDLNTNIKYISKAININCGTNFNVFVNTYRVNLVKDMLNKNYQNKYTIRYIYTSVGFRNQSTFNKAFKQIADITPSEYIKEINKERKENV